MAPLRNPSQLKPIVVVFVECVYCGPTSGNVHSGPALHTSARLFYSMLILIISQFFCSCFALLAPSFLLFGVCASPSCNIRLAHSPGVVLFISELCFQTRV